MDKNKSRADLLTAGRKKLQQFRQKKDGKGGSSHGKSSKKSSKSELQSSEVDEVSITANSVALSQVPETEIASSLDCNLGVSDSSVSNSMENLVASDVGNEAVDQLTTPMTPETALADNANMDEQALGFHENTLDSLDLNNGESVDVSVSPAMVDTPDSTIVTVAMESINRETEESLPSQDSPDVSLVCARGDQVTDVGAMQEADGLGLKQFGANCVTELEENGRFAVFERGDNAETAERPALEQIGIESMASEVGQNVRAGGEYASAGAISDGILAYSFSLSEAGEILGVHEVKNQTGEVTNAVAANTEKSEILSRTAQHGTSGECCQANSIPEACEQYMPDEPFVFVGKSHEEPLLTKSTNPNDGCTTSALGGASPINFSQLIEAIKEISEDEYRLLLMSRGCDRSLISLQHGFPVLMEKLSEELFLASCMKDLLLVQLSEQSNLQTESDHQFQQSDDEISVLHVSLNEARQRCDYLAEELAECRSELQITVGGREELQVQLHASKVEVEEVSARANELQNCFERSQSDLLSLSKESAETKGLVGALHAENENLKQTIASLTEESKKLVEEKNACFYENEMLLTKLADCKNIVAALQMDSSNLSETLASLAEKSKKLEEEKDNLADGNEKLTLELSDCKGTMEALQLENANIRGGLVMVIEDRKKLEKEKEHSDHEMQRLSSELLILHDRLSKDQGEHMQLEIDLKEVKMHLEQLTEENMFLKSSLELHKANTTEIDDRQIQRSLTIGEVTNDVGILEVQSRGCENEAVHEQSQQMPEERDGKSSLSMLEKSIPYSLSGGQPPESSELEVFNNSLGFVVMKRRLEEAEIALQKLEKAIEGMHLDRSAVKLAAPAVSKLIQAFESKTHDHEHEAEERDMTEDISPEADPFALARKHMGDLIQVLEQFTSDAVDASLLFKAERDGRTAANLTIEELKVQFEVMEEHTKDLEAANIELGILYEAVKQQVFGVKEKNEELKDLYETLKQEDNHLKAENGELGVKLSECELRVTELQNQLNDLQQSSDELASVLNSQLENFQKEAADRVSRVEQEWNSTISQIIEAVRRLNDSTGFLIPSAIITGGDHCIDISSHASASIDAAIKSIGELKEKLEVACSDQEATFNLFKEVNDKCNELLRKNELTSGILHRLCDELRKLVRGSCGSVEETEVGIQDVELSDPVDCSGYKTLVEQLENFLAERLQLQSVNDKLNLELMSRTKDFEELNRRCVDLSSIEKLIKLVEGVVELEDTDMDGMPILHLELLVSSLVRKCREAEEQGILSKEKFGSKVEELTELRENIDQLTALKLQHETEILLLKERLSQVEEVLSGTESELQEKVAELGKSEQRVSSIREKLIIAVAKGKGLVVQRDSLKQSLSETSSELERCSQELQLKDGRIHEVETKLKAYSEAGERVEALESELAYIRNSATTLRESFLLKDSVLQRIEEILEDLDLPEHFHSRGIIEKVDWLARSANGNSLPPADWDQKSSVGGSYSDAGFVVMDAWKEDAQPSSNSGDDLRRRYEDLQGKFYGLAEQNEMLEQSLMERNQLVQRWEELLDRIDMPAQLRSMEPENRIEWLGKALLEAKHDRDSLLQNIYKLENYCGSLTADMEQSQNRVSYQNAELEESQKRISDLEKDIRAIIQEREDLSERLKILSCDHEELSMKAVQFGHDNKKLQNELTGLQEKLVQNEECVQRINGEICRLQDLVCDVLKDPGMEDILSVGDCVECLEGLLRKLVDKYTTLSLMKPVLQDAVEEHYVEEADASSDEGRARDILEDTESNVALLKGEMADNDEPNVDVLKKELEDTLSELIHVKEERDKYMERQQSLVCEIEALERKMMELQELLNQEEQKSTSLREKLTVAVRKGKYLVQQRDNLKQTIEEMSTEFEQLKSDIKHRENALADYELKMRDLISYSERVEALESESLIMKNHLAENERVLQEKEHTLSMIVNTIREIIVGSEIDNSDPIKQLEHIGKLCRDFHAVVASCEEESRKSRRAAELLLAELNEVQDRNDGLQEEVAKVTVELTCLSKDKDVIEAEKFEALSCLEKMSLFFTEEKKKRNSELVLIKSVANQLRKSYSDITDLLANLFSKDLECLQDLESGMSSCLERTEADLMVNVPLSSASGGIISWDLENKESFMAEDFSSEINMPDHLDNDFITEVFNSLQEFKKEIAATEVILHDHSVTFRKQASNLFKLMGSIHRDMTSQKESFDALKRDVKLIDSVEKEKEMEIVTLRKNMALLYEACSCLLMEIENRKAELVTNVLTVGDQGLNLKPATFGDAENNFSSDKDVKTVAEKMLSAVKNFASLKGEIIEGDKKEMRITISNLQKELQEKDIQRERICKDLVSQIKQAESAATSYSKDLQSTKSHLHDLEKRVEIIEEERNLLEQKVQELQDQQTISMDLQEKIRSLTNMLSAKDQEIEVLMQALDEEEVQMEDLTKKFEELEKVVQLKNLDIENLEASRGKAVKKLSITVTKFDELHHFSESLLAEVEKLQSQLQDRDSEISFLRQEVTKCTNDVLAASQANSKRNSDEIYELLAWLGSRVSLDINLEECNPVQEFKEMIQRKITSVFSELEDLQAAAQNWDTLFQIERSKVDELTRREESLEKSLREKEAQLNMQGVDGDLSQPTSANSEILEVEPIVNKWTIPGAPATSQVRSLRKLNNDQVAIAIDMDPGGTSKLEDEDDEKAHGFKSLTSSRIVPKFTRPVTDMVDGLWVSCDWALMRQPGLRLGIMIYWAVLHALLAAFVV